MWERLRRFSQLPAAAQGQFLRAAVLLPWVALRLKRQGFQATRDALLKGSLPENFQDNSNDSEDRARWTARMVRAAARHSFGDPSCLEESLVLVHLLRRQGIETQLRIGVKRNHPKFEAHAWVEFRGAALNESEALHDYYAPFEAEFSSLPPEKS